MGGGIGGVHQEKGFHGGVFQLDQFGFGDIPSIFLRAAHVDRHQAVILHGRDLHIGGEDGCADGNLISGFQQLIMTERLEDVHHGRAAAFRGKNLRFRRKVLAAVQRGLQISVLNGFRAGQAPAGGRIVVANDGVSKLLEQDVLIQAQGVHAVIHGGNQESVGRILRVHGRVKAFAHAFQFPVPRHAALAHIQLTFADGEIHEPGEGVARLGVDPVGIAPPRVQHGIACFIGLCQFPLHGGDFKRAQFLFQLRFRFLVQRNHIPVLGQGGGDCHAQNQINDDCAQNSVFHMKRFPLPMRFFPVRLSISAVTPSPARYASRNHRFSNS